MDPGPWLDRLVHRRCVRRGDPYAAVAFDEAVPPYSTDIATAWVAVESERLSGGYVGLSARPEGHWVASRHKGLNPRGDGTADDYDETHPSTSAKADTAAHAICLALVGSGFDLPKDVADSHLIECIFCEVTAVEHHSPGCPGSG